MSPLLRALAAALLLAPGLAPLLHAADRKDEAVDPYTKGDPELMAKLGIVSFGPFPFARTDTKDVERVLGVVDVKWIETEHFEIGFGLGPYKVRQEERKKIRAELERLQLTLEDINPKQTLLDPWLRAHLFAQRLEDAHQQFLEVVQLTDEDFPDGTEPFVPGQGKEYMGEGPYLGMKGKYEVLILPSEAAHLTYLRHYFGLQNKRTQRWHLPDLGTISTTTHEAHGRLRVDTAMHAHVVWNASHNFFDGLRHYSYQTPVWLHEGLAHWMGRQITPEYNSFDGDEGAIPEMSREDDWEGEVRKLVASGDAPRLGEMVGFANYGDLELDHHFTTWSMVDFLAKEHPDALAALVRGLKGIVDEAGYPDGTLVDDRQRALFREHLGMSYLQFDEAWRAWVGANY